MKWWNRFKYWVTGKRWFVGYDPGTKNGDYSTIMWGYVDRKGVFHIVGHNNEVG